MKALFWPVCCAGLLSLCSCGPRVARVESVDIVPRPVTVEASDGAFDLTRSTKICLLSDDTMLLRSADFFNGLLQPSLGRALKVETGACADSDAIRVELGDLAPEAYEISIRPEGVRIVGGSPAGVYYAFQTIRQLLPEPVLRGEKAGVVELPVVEIADQPYFAYRGGMLDVGRHFFSVDDVKEFIDILAMHKINRFHWHLTQDQGWRIEIKKYPELTRVGAFRDRCDLDPAAPNDSVPYGGFYTQDEAREIVRYAADRFITVIPEIEMPGHAMAALAAYPSLGCLGEGYEVPSVWGVKEDVFCAGNDSTFRLLEDVLTEVIDLFPSEYIHIGGDECPKVRWKACPKCQKRIRDEKLKDEFELQSYFVQRMEKFLNGKGRKIIGWDEILEGRAPSDAVVMSWRGSEGGIAAAKLGHDVIMTPNSHFYFDYYQSLDTDAEPFGIGGYIPMEQVYSYDPAFPELTPEQQKHILGVQANLWTEYVLSDEHLEYMLLPRLAALSEVQWCLPETKDWNRFIGSFRMDKIYSQLGCEFAKHIFGVTASYAVDPEKGGVVMTLTTQGGAPIRYTLDGSDPTASSPLYKAPVTIGESCTFKAAALREGMQTPVYTRKFDFNKATGRRIALNAAPTLKYTYGGASLLVDGYRGGPVYSNGAWIGFLNEPLDVTIDMQGAKPYSAVTVESLVEKGEWVFPPSSVGVYLSDDGREFTEAALMSVPQETAGSPDGVKPFKVLFPETSARYLRVVARTVDPIPAWHGAAGQKAHMFVDEIIVE